MREKRRGDRTEGEGEEGEGTESGRKNEFKI